MQPETPTVVQGKIRHIPGQRHFLATFFISLIWGTLGVDRMYLGKWGTGILKLITVGGFGLWTLVDLVLIMNGSMRDVWGREMLDAARYKRFAYNTTLIFAIAVGLAVLFTGLSLIYTITQFMNGDMTIPGLDSLTSTSAGGLTPGQMSELGL